MPDDAKGRACLNFYTLEVENEEIVENEALSFIGNIVEEENKMLFKIERQLPNLSFQRGFRGTLSTISEMRRMGKRAEAEAARRGQPLPNISL